MNENINSGMNENINSDMVVVLSQTPFFSTPP